MEKILILGGARGLGAAFCNLWQQRGRDQMVVTSRKSLTLVGIESRICDFSKKNDIENLLVFMDQWRPQRVFCFAGGGPYGAYAEKDWKDHLWALQVSLLAPLEVLHHFVKSQEGRQMVIVGSAIAESAPDPFAASYSAAKHGLLGAVSSLQGEGLQKDIRLFSPGYMSTDMLPNKAIADKKLKVSSAEQTAQLMFNWVQDKQGSWHLCHALPSL